MVWSGHYAPEDVIDWVAEDAGADASWVRGQVQAEWERKAAAEMTWGTPTDCDRLNDAFDELWAQNIIALQAVGDMYFDGMEDVQHYWARAGRERSLVEGYCFCHQEEMKNCLAGGTLRLAFGGILGGDPEKAVAMGRIVCEVLARHGFRPIWDETEHSKIALPGFHWQKTRASFLQHEAKIEEHCAVLQASLKLVIRPPPARLDLRGDAPVVLMRFFRVYVACIGVGGSLAATGVLWEAQANPGKEPDVPLVAAWLALTLAGFLFLFGINRWRHWWYAVPLWVGPVVFLTLAANFEKFAPSVHPDDAVLTSTWVAIAVGLQAAWWTYGFFKKRTGDT